jgi:hypothetical protein
MKTYLKVALSAAALAALAVVPAAAKARTQHHSAPASTGIYQSYSQGYQSYPNPDRGPYPTPVPAWAQE